ncbi:MAG TPA: S49 family peptidase [Candidatus Eisenbacteria bacterium]|nr:S49 family peptidase [Candidatus Eisenbacteria bacterium]
MIRPRLVIALLAATLAAAAPAPTAHAGLEPYAESNDPMAATPSTDDGSFGAWHNPAAWGVPERSLLDFSYFDRDGEIQDLEDWHLGFGRGLGIAVRHRGDVPRRPDPRIVPFDAQNPYFEPYPGARPALPSLTEYQVALAGGNGRRFGGLAWHLTGGGGHAWRRSNYLSLGQIERPGRHLSVGWAARWAPATGGGATVIDVGIRPLGTSRLTLFADFSARGLARWDDGSIGAGAILKPLDGLELSGRWRDNDRFQFTAGLTLARFGVRATPIIRRRERWPGYADLTGERRDSDDHVGTWYSVRFNPPLRGLDVERRASKNRSFLELDLHGRAVYQSYRWFDDDALPLRDLTERIRFAKADPTVGGVAIRLSGFRANLSTLWEVRQSLLALKQAGKKVLVSCDNLDQASFYLASVADHITMDPTGLLVAPGVQASRTYMKDLLGKLGLGFDEWRYYKYKSAMETFSRTSFSDADREQWEAIVRATYEELASGIAASGRTTRAEYDRVVNEEPLVTASRLKELGWVDSLGRWEDMAEAEVKRHGGRGKPLAYAPLRERRWQPDETWGPVPAIGLVYLIGECAMDTGIRARDTAPAMKRLREDGDVRAVVLRVDSPGGDALASDLVAEETRRLRKAGKATLVSQGRVAGSGGYWISMDADQIATGPFTLTGSIGIIGGWVWNDGFGRKTGLASDRVQIGKSADLQGGLRVPFLGATLPERNLDEGERRVIGGVFAEMYERFTGLVATARGLEPARVRELAEGRVYDGPAAVRNGLVDRVATLEETIEDAKRRAGIAPDRRVRIVEVPARRLIRLPRFLPGVRQADPDAGAEPRLLETGVLQQILERPGRPLLAMPGALLPLEDEPVR